MTETASGAKAGNPWLRIGLPLGAVFVADRLTKYWVRGHMDVGDSVPVIPGFFHLTYILNPGAAFGFLPEQGWLFVAAGFAVVGALIVCRRLIMALPVAAGCCVGLIAGGAAGNLFDRLTIGEVVDFLDFKIWSYIFNLADSAIVVSGILLCLMLLREEKPAPQAKE
ncbi:MAG: signal peptidase II [Gracilibacteraceae bacterium]|jgi:signal peptidase II|nr:signal peptidase II [Gracilibacteraceae bacterium]